MKRIVSSVCVVLTTLLFTGSVVAAQAQSHYTPGAKGIDISWANCGVRFPNNRDFGIVGVNNGTGYSTNPCLAQEAGHFTDLSLYVNTGWNDQSSFINPTSPKACSAGGEDCLAYNYGYNAGLYAYNAAKTAGERTNTWWLDVETLNTWNNDTVQNQNSLQGEYDALQAAHGVKTVGVYSTTAEWQTITGGWQNNWPSWGATTWANASQAKKFCTGHQFTGGPSYLMQYTPPKAAFDRDVAC